jgi:hypothetical protein
MILAPASASRSLAASRSSLTELLKRYQRPAEDAPEDASLVLTRFFAWST